MINYKVDHPLIESCWSEEYDSGIIHILFNTVLRYESFHAYTEGEYKFGEDDENDEPKVVKLKSEHIDKIKAGSYLPTTIQVKDQISYYYIPYYLILGKEMWVNSCKLNKRLIEEQKEFAQSKIDKKDNVEFWTKQLIFLKTKQEFYERII